MQVEKLPLPEWLPPGWVMEVRERLSGLKDKYYTETISGHKFRSKREVIRYLGNEVKAIREKGGGACKSEDRIVKKLLDWLPSGWKVELQERKSRCVTDKYYVEPVFGYKFRSKKEVTRYLENGVLPTKVGNTRKVHSAESTSREISLSTVVKSEGLDWKTRRRLLVTGLTRKTENGESILESSRKEVENKGNENAIEQYRNGVQHSCESSLICEEGILVPPISSIQPESGKQRSRKIKHKEEFGSVGRSSRRLAGLEPELVPEMMMMEGNGEGGEEQQNELAGMLGCVEPEFKITFREALLDPCLSFAFKTLTGNIPVENKLPIPDFLHHPVTSSLHKGNRLF